MIGSDSVNFPILMEPSGYLIFKDIPSDGSSRSAIRWHRSLIAFHVHKDVTINNRVQKIIQNKFLHITNHSTSFLDILKGPFPDLL